MTIEQLAMNMDYSHADFIAKFRSSACQGLPSTRSIDYVTNLPAKTYR